MKKFSIVAVLAIMAVAFTGCGNSAPKANLKNDVDTLTYAHGYAPVSGSEGLSRRPYGYGHNLYGRVLPWS